MYLLPLSKVGLNEYRHRFRLYLRKLFWIFNYLNGRYSQSCYGNFFLFFHKMYKTELNLIFPFSTHFMEYFSFILFYREGLVVFDCIKKN